MCKAYEVVESLLFFEQGVLAFLVELAERLGGGGTDAFLCTLVIHVAREEFIERCAVDWVENFGGYLFEFFPRFDEVVFAPKRGIVFVELSLEDIGIGERFTAVIECGEDAQGCILRLGLNGEENAVVKDAKGKIGEVACEFLEEIVNLILEEAEVVGIVALHSTFRNTIFEDRKELILVIVCGHLGVYFEVVLVILAKAIGSPYALLNVLLHLDRTRVLHVEELIVKGAKEEHESCEALLSIDDLHFVAIVFKRNYGAEEVLFRVIELLEIVVGEAEGEEVFPQSVALVISPGVGTLVVGN